MLPNITNVFTDFMIIYFGDNTFPDIVAVTFAGYPDFTKAMLARGWFQNEDKDRLASSQQTESVTAKLWPFHLLLSILVPRTRLREVGYLIIIYIYIYNIVYYIYTSLVYILCVYTWYIYIYHISYIEIIMEASKSWASMVSEGFALLRYEMGSGSRHGSWQPPTWTGDSAAESPRVGNCRSLGVELTRTALASCHWLRNISIYFNQWFSACWAVLKAMGTTRTQVVNHFHGSREITTKEPSWGLWGHGGSQFSSVRFLPPCGTIGQ